jgi:hypothetical protein
MVVAVKDRPIKIMYLTLNTTFTHFTQLRNTKPKPPESVGKKQKGIWTHKRGKLM